MIFDVKATQADWLPIYNTGSNNYNAADFWRNAEGALGSGSYSDAGVMPLNTWVRLVVVRMLEGGSWVRDVYVDGTLVFDDLGTEGGDGNSSLYTNAQEDDGQFTILSDSDATVYAGCELANFAYVSLALSAEAVADLGEFNEGGIFDVSSTGASKPLPDEEAVDVLRDATLSWKPGAFAGTHDVYFGEAFADVSGATRANPMGVQLAQGQTETSIDAGRLAFDQTYYWRVDEVNEAQIPSVWAGPVWSLSTSVGLVVDDFESYSNNSPDRPFQTWLDGFGYSEDEYFPVGSPGNGTGAGIGHDIWSLSSPNYGETIMEGSITLEGSSQSMPLYYNNSGVASQTDRVWAVPQNWTVGGAASLVLYFYGREDNTGGPLFATINGQKVTYPETADLGVALWHQWTIDLAALGIDLNAVTSMSLGVEGAGSGMILIDDITYKP